MPEKNIKQVCKFQIKKHSVAGKSFMIIREKGKDLRSLGMKWWFVMQSFLSRYTCGFIQSVIFGWFIGGVMVVGDDEKFCFVAVAACVYYWKLWLYCKHVNA